MVKGVNKTVIEINDTGSNMFDKIILFVAPQYSGLSVSRLRSEAEKTVRECAVGRLQLTARQRYMRRKRITRLCVFGGLILAAALLLLIFK